MRIGLIFFGFLVAVSLGACASGRSDTLDATLPRLDAASEVKLESCPTAKCLTVYVAPWCGVCRGSTGLITALKSHLAARGVAARVVVGLDAPQNVRDYAAEFGPDTLLDPEGRVRIAGGVPQFIVTDNMGKVLKRMSGVPGGLRAPYAQELLRDFAAYLDLGG